MWIFLVPTQHLLIQIQQWKHQNYGRNLFKSGHSCRSGVFHDDDDDDDDDEWFLCYGWLNLRRTRVKALLNEVVQ